MVDSDPKLIQQQFNINAESKIWYEDEDDERFL